MTGLKNGLAELLKEMTKQECYRNYTQCLEKIKSDEKLYRELNDFRRKNVEIHFNKGALKEEAMLEEEYHSLLLHETVHEFLIWEQKTLEMLRMIHDSIDAGLELDFSFM